MIAGCSSMGGARTEHRAVLSDSTTKVKTMVPWEGSDPEPCHVHFPSEFQSKCGNRKVGGGRGARLIAPRRMTTTLHFYRFPQQRSVSI